MLRETQRSLSQLDDLIMIYIYIYIYIYCPHQCGHWIAVWRTYQARLNDRNGWREKVWGAPSYTNDLIMTIYIHIYIYRERERVRVRERVKVIEPFLINYNVFLKSYSNKYKMMIFLSICLNTLVGFLVFSFLLRQGILLIYLSTYLPQNNPN